MIFEAWILSYQDSRKASKEAFREWMYWRRECAMLREELRQAKLELIAINTMSYEQLKEHVNHVQEQAK